MTEQKKLAWDEIVENDDLLARMWNKFVQEDEEVAKEGVFLLIFLRFLEARWFP